MSTSADYAQFLRTALTAVEEANKTIDSLAGDRAAIRKADGSLVTETDRAVDERIEHLLRTRHPDHRVLCEERHTFYAPSATYTWVVDPLDGTTNFARGLPVWGVSVALLRDGVPVVGVLAFPLLHEAFSAISGEGATCNGHPIRAATNADDDDQHFIMCCTRTHRRYHLETPLKPRILGSAAYHLAKVADGSALAAVEATPKIWDLAAALLILTESGAVYRQLHTPAPLFPLPPVQADYRAQSFPLLAAGTPRLLSRLSEKIQRRR